MLIAICFKLFLPNMDFPDSIIMLKRCHMIKYDIVTHVFVNRKHFRHVFSFVITLYSDIFKIFVRFLAPI